MTARTLWQVCSARLRWHGSASYWERRYAKGGSSGDGSYGRKAQHKADVINRMISENELVSVIELGCGDGNQLTLADYSEYLGLDVSATAIRQCLELHGDDPSKSFILYSADHFSDRRPWLSAGVSLSLEVIFHLVEDEVFSLHEDSVLDGDPTGHNFCIGLR